MSKYDPVTRTFRVPLGTSLLTGKQGLGQAARFKRQLRSPQQKPDSVSLLTVVSVEPPTTGVTAIYNADDPCAVEWMRHAEATSAELGQTLAERRKGTVM